MRRTAAGLRSCTWTHGYTVRRRSSCADLPTSRLKPLMPCFVTHLESALDGTHLPADRAQTLHNDRPLWVRYDLDGGRPRGLASDDLAAPRDVAVALSRVAALCRCRRGRLARRNHDAAGALPATWARRFGLANLWVKDESRLPTGSFKSRGLAMAVTHGQAVRARRGWRFPRPATPAERWRPMRPGPAWKPSCSCPTTRRPSTSTNATWPGRRRFWCRA